MTLRGAVLTADTENRERVEKIVTATLDGKPVPITWAAGERSHGFAIRDIARRSDEQEVVVSLGRRAARRREQGLAELAHSGARRIRGHADAGRAGQRSAPDPGAVLRRARCAPGSEGPDPAVEGRIHHQHQQQPAHAVRERGRQWAKSRSRSSPAIRSRAGQPLIGEREFKLEFTNTKPQVRFVGQGVILPDAADAHACRSRR